MKKSLLVLGAVLCCFGANCMVPNATLQDIEDNQIVINRDDQHDVVQVQPERRPIWKKVLKVALITGGVALALYVARDVLLYFMYDREEENNDAESWQEWHDRLVAYRYLFLEPSGLLDRNTALRELLDDARIRYP